MFQLDKIIRKILTFSPLIFLIYTPWTFYPAIFGRSIVFQILVEFILLMLLARSFVLTRRLGSTSFIGYISKIRHTFSSPVGVGLVMFTLAQFISFVSSVDREQSFWGSMSRMDGVFSWLHMIVFFALLVSFFEKKDWIGLMITNTLVAGFLSILAVLQHYHDLIPKYIIQSGRVYATFGNPVFFALYILLSIYIGILLFTEFTNNLDTLKRSLKQFFVAVSVVLQLVALYFTNSQGAILGLIVGLGLIVMLLVTGKLKKIHYKIVFWCLAGVIVITALLTTHQGRVILHGEINKTEGLSARLVVWKMGLEGWLERPVLGFGPSTFEYVFDKYYDPELLRFSFYETVSNKPHNIIVEILSQTGVTGFVSYVGIMVAVIFALWRLRRRSLYTSIIGCSFLLSYITALQFAFDTTNSWYMWMIFLAYITYVAKEQRSNRAIEQESREIPQQALQSGAGRATKNEKKFALLFICSSVLVITAALWFGNIEAWAASVPAARSENSYWYQKPVKWGDEIRRSLSLRTPYHDEIRVILSQDLIVWEASGSLAAEDVVDAIYTARESLAQSTVQHRNNFQYYFTLGQVESILGEHENSLNFENARIALETALTISPKRQAAHLILGRILIGQGKLDEAEAVIGRSIELYEKSGISHWFFGLAKLLNGKPKDGVAEFWRAYGLDYQLTPNEFSYWLSVNERLAYREDNIKLHVILARRFPSQSAKHYVRIHKLYTELGDETQASFFKRFSELESKDQDIRGLTVDEIRELIEANTKIENHYRNGDLYKQLIELVPDQKKSIAKEATNYFIKYGNQGLTEAFKQLAR